MSNKCSVRQAVKSLPFHGKVTGSIPVQSTTSRSVEDGYPPSLIS
jgi:hypothetical protein